jgi:hypothetical protein
VAREGRLWVLNHGRKEQDGSRAMDVIFRLRQNHRAQIMFISHFIPENQIRAKGGSGKGEREKEGMRNNMEKW